MSTHCYAVNFIQTDIISRNTVIVNFKWYKIRFKWWFQIACELCNVWRKISCWVKDEIQYWPVVYYCCRRVVFTSDNPVTGIHLQTSNTSSVQHLLRCWVHRHLRTSSPPIHSATTEFAHLHPKADIETISVEDWGSVSSHIIIHTSIGSLGYDHLSTLY